MLSLLYNRQLQPCEVSKPKMERAELLLHTRPITAEHTCTLGITVINTFLLEALIAARNGPGPCWCCCHGNMVCTQERPPSCENTIIGVVLSCFRASQLRKQVCHQTSVVNLTADRIYRYIYHFLIFLISCALTTSNIISLQFQVTTLELQSCCCCARENDCAGQGAQLPLFLCVRHVHANARAHTHTHRRLPSNIL